MSFYFRHKYNFTFHGLHRIKERVKEFADYNEWQIKEKIIKMIENSSSIINTKTCYYIKLDDLQGNLYVVVSKDNNLVLTVTPISPGKMLSVIERN